MSENGEPDLPTIPEEDLSEKKPPEDEEKIELEPAKPEDQPDTVDIVETGDPDEPQVVVPPAENVETQESVKEGEKQQKTKRGEKNKKGKKSKPEKVDIEEDETPAKKSKDILEPSEDGEHEKPPKKGKKKKAPTVSEEGEEPVKKRKKGKKEKLETEEEPDLVDTEPESAEPSSKTGVEGKPKKKEKKGKKDRKEKKSKEDKKEKEELKDTGDEEPQPEEKRRLTRASRLPIEGEYDSKMEFRKSAARVSSVVEPQDGEKKGKKKKKPRRSTFIGSSGVKDIYRKYSVRESDMSDIMDFTERYKSRLSGVSTQSSESSGSLLEDGEERIGGKKKGKKGKKGKELTEEQKEQKKAKEAEKKKAKKEAREAAKEKKKSDEKHKESPFDDMRKKLEDFKKKAKEMGIDEKFIGVEGEEPVAKGPKKKKKEKAKMTGEMAEKARLEMEAQAKRLEEMIKKKVEEERLAAIEQDKKDITEQGLRLEQLQDSTSLIEEIVQANAEVIRVEKELLEWQKYIECGKLPDPARCDQMNTYLHLWELDMNKTSMKDTSNKTVDAIKLLNDLDELIDTVTEEESHNLENWKWVRQLFRSYQSESLDVATYRLLRDVEHNLNRLNIPTADFSFKDDHVTMCLWLRVMLPIPLPNPRRPPKPRVDISYDEMDLSVLFPLTIDCMNAAIRAMYHKYDHLSDLCQSFHIPDLPEDSRRTGNLLSAIKKEWQVKLKYKYDNRDKTLLNPSKPILTQDTETERSSVTAENQTEQKSDLDASNILQKTLRFEGHEISSDDEIPLVPFKQLKPPPNEHAISVEDTLYDSARTGLQLYYPVEIINLRKFVILGGVFHLNLLAQPPQPQDFVTMDMTVTGLYVPKKLEVLPFKVIYTPYVPPEPEPISESIVNVTLSMSVSQRRLPEELEEELKKQEDELDKLIFINVKWPQHVIFLELPIVCRWDEEKNQWSNEEIIDVKHNEDKCMLSFRTGVFGVYALATYRYCNLPFQAYDIKPEINGSVTVQLTAAILMLEFNIKDGLIAITQLQNSPNMTLQDIVGNYMKLHKLKSMMKEAGIDIFPAFDAFCYVDGSCEKHWPMEQHLYYNMAQISNSFNFAWSRWNLQAGRRKIIMQMRQYSPDKGKQKNHQMLLVTPLKAAFIECTEVSQTFLDKEVESTKFSADLFHLMKASSSIFVRNNVNKASKQNIYTLAQFLISIRVLSFS